MPCFTFPLGIDGIPSYLSTTTCFLLRSWSLFLNFLSCDFYSADIWEHQHKYERTSWNYVKTLFFKKHSIHSHVVQYSGSFSCWSINHGSTSADVRPEHSPTIVWTRWSFWPVFSFVKAHIGAHFYLMHACHGWESRPGGPITTQARNTPCRAASPAFQWSQTP